MAENTYVSLFAGSGGLDLAVRVALPQSRCILYVEREAPAAASLASRIDDGSLDAAPIWADVRTVPWHLYRGRVAGLVGGFPCQDLSVAGKQAGIHGDKSGLFFEFIRAFRELESVEWMFCENVPPVLAYPAGTTVLGELAKLGLDAEWGTIRASDVGAPHKRDRAFILAYKPGLKWRRESFRLSRSAISSGAACERTELADPGCQREQLQQRQIRDEYQGSGNELGDASGYNERRQPERVVGTQEPARGSGSIMGIAASEGLEVRGGQRGDPRQEQPSAERTSVMDDAGCPERWPDAQLVGCGGEGRHREGQAAGWLSEPSLPLFPPGPGNTEAWAAIIDERPDLAPAKETPQSGVCRLADEYRRVDRLRAVGNSVVALQGAAALVSLARRAGII